MTTGSMTVRLDGNDDPTQENSLDVTMACCIAGGPAKHTLSLDLDAYPALQIPFYGWKASGGEKYNRLGEHIGTDLTNLGRGKGYLSPHAEVPFGPDFDAFAFGNSDGTWNQSKSNMFDVPSNGVYYFVPNLFDTFGSNPKVLNDPTNTRRELWSSQDPSYDTNWYWYWYWYCLLHRLEADPMGLT